MRIVRMWQSDISDSTRISSLGYNGVALLQVC